MSSDGKVPRPKTICDKCGKIHVAHNGAPACAGHRSDGSGIACTKVPMRGGRVCRSHGGALSVTRIAAAERLALMSAEGEIGDLMRECDIPEQHPIQGLLEVIRISGSFTRLLTIKVGELREEPEVKDVLVEGKDGELSTKKESSGDALWGLNHQGEMTPHVYVTLLKLWSERYERACKTALDAGVAERTVRLAESEGELVASAIKGILTALNLTPEQLAAAPRIVAEQLREIQ